MKFHPVECGVLFNQIVEEGEPMNGKFKHVWYDGCFTEKFVRLFNTSPLPTWGVEIHERQQP